MPRADHGAVEADLDGNRALVELAVIHFRSDDVFGGSPWRGAGYERTHKHPCDRRVAVWKVKVVRIAPGSRITSGRETHARVWTRIEFQSLKTGILEAPAIESGDCVDSDTIESASARLIKGNDGGIRLDDIQQIVPVAHPREAAFLFVRRDPREIVVLAVLNAQDVTLNFGSQWCAPQKCFPFDPVLGACHVRSAGRAHYEPVGTKSLFVKEVSGFQVLVDIRDIAFPGQRVGIDAQVRHQTARHFTVGEGRLDRPSTSVS